MADRSVRAGARSAIFGRHATSVTSGPDALELVGHSPAITRVQELVRRAAPLDVGVLLTAERGADVDSVAREIHGRSRRAEAPYVVVECDGADAASLGQLLFGTVSTTSPVSAVSPSAVLASTPTDLEPIARDSRLAAARGGTLFLQDVTELPAAIQARLARHRARRRSAARRRAGNDRRSPGRQRVARRRRRCPRAPPASRSVPSAVGRAHRSAAAPGPPGRRAGHCGARPRRSH